MRVYHLPGERRNSGLVSIGESQHQDHCTWGKKIRILDSCGGKLFTQLLKSFYKQPWCPSDDDGFKG